MVREHRPQPGDVVGSADEAGQRDGQVRAGHFGAGWRAGCVVVPAVGDAPFEVDELGRGRRAELVGQVAVVLLVDAERFGLASLGGEGPHGQPRRAVPQGMLGVVVLHRRAESAKRPTAMSAFSPVLHGGGAVAR